ncbi:DgyrCDS11931 [Dimorphilus gyrociliatus]|uniref:DgyrCDS11931 n=1 Tax=Dimorphilus gyrociliatus TaxID=2664684 RepID=A0A7I8W8E1_9ANNE|nr:DgyrCDS11931 [Dimorphilus gyrociliatus]
MKSDTFREDFQELLPAFLSSDTCLEMFHYLLDLPCVAAAVETREKLQANNDSVLETLVDFITRNESGSTDTVDKLKQLHGALKLSNTSYSVVSCSKNVAPLLERFFSQVYEEDDIDILKKLCPSIIERSLSLYDVEGYREEIEIVLGKYFLKFLQLHPDIIGEMQYEMSIFLSCLPGIMSAPTLASNLVWCVGEFLSSEISTKCTIETTTSMYESFEALAYEVSKNLADNDESYSKFLSCLMSALCKLSSRNQQLTARVLICLSKLANQQTTNDKMKGNIKKIIVDRANELSAILKIPNFASVLFNRRLSEKGKRNITVVETTARFLRQEY